MRLHQRELTGAWPPFRLDRKGRDDSMSLTELPEWVWELVAGLSRYEDEHPILYRMTASGEYERTPCPDELTGIIPREVRDAAELLASRGAIKVTSMFSETT